LALVTDLLCGGSPLRSGSRPVLGRPERKVEKAAGKVQNAVGGAKDAARDALKK